MARSDPQVNFRMPADLKDRIEIAAKENNRSATAEIVHRLSLSFEKEEIAKEQPLPRRPLPEGVQVDYESQVWAERLLKPGNRHELENMLAVMRAALNLTAEKIEADVRRAMAILPSDVLIKKLGADENLAPDGHPKENPTPRGPVIRRARPKKE